MTLTGEGIKPVIPDRQRLIEQLSHALQHPSFGGHIQRANPLYQWIGHIPGHRQAWLRKPRKEHIIWGIPPFR